MPSGVEDIRSEKRSREPDRLLGELLIVATYGRVVASKLAPARLLTSRAGD